MKIRTSVDINMDDIISGIDSHDGIELIKGIDKHIADWTFTLDIFKYLIESMYNDREELADGGEEDIVEFGNGHKISLHDLLYYCIDVKSYDNDIAGLPVVCRRKISVMYNDFMKIIYLLLKRLGGSVQISKFEMANIGPRVPVHHTHNTVTGDYIYWIDEK